MKKLLRTFHDSTDGHTCSVFQDTETGEYIEFDHETEEESWIDESDWHVCGY